VLQHADVLLICSSRDLSGSSADRHEILHRDRTYAEYYELSQQNMVPSENIGSKNMRNLARFRASFDFDCEYLRN